MEHIDHHHHILRCEWEGGKGGGGGGVKGGNASHAWEMRQHRISALCLKTGCLHSICMEVSTAVGGAEVVVYQGGVHMCLRLSTTYTAKAGVLSQPPNG